jgi:hypothetical protein
MSDEVYEVPAPPLVSNCCARFSRTHAACTRPRGIATTSRPETS